MIDIVPGVGISEHELRFSFERSPGPGGQNVNKTSTRVTLHFDIARSMSLSRVQKTRVRKVLASRVNQDGVLRIVSSKERTQLANRRAAVNRLVELVTEALHTPKPRKETRVPPSANKKRLEEKTKRGALKRLRQTRISAEK